MNVNNSKRMFLLALSLLTGMLAGCQQDALTGENGITDDRPFAYIVRDFPVMGETSSIDSRPPLDPRAPYQFNSRFGYSPGFN